MNQNRFCKRCNSSLCQMDPHTVCKSCRQPDPQMFYCSEEDCEACSVIKVFKPLDLYLRKQELENLAKKLNQFATHHSKPEKSTYNKKNLDMFNKNSFLNLPPDFENKISDFSSDIFSSMLKGMEKEKSDNSNSYSMKSDNSCPSTSGSNRNDNLKDMEKRLYDKVMSTIMTSWSDNKGNQAEGCNNNSSSILKSSTQANSHSTTMNSRVIELDKDENELHSIMISLFEEVCPDSFTKVNKGVNENGKNECVFKISSRASDILLRETVFSSPAEASKLCNELKIESDGSYWPLKLNAADVLHSNFSKLPSMKLHPKIRHMHSLLFGKLNPSIPQELLGENYTLPVVSIELKNEFIFAREQLHRLLLIFSVVDYFSGEKILQENSSIATFVELLLNHIKLCMEKQANFVGLLIQEIRRDLLSDAECKIPDAVSKLILGPIHQAHFFGPYVKELQEIINKNGSSFCLSSKSENANVNLFKLPLKFKEGDSTEKFLINLKIFFEANTTNEKDKIAILESLLPDTVIDRLNKFLKPNKLSDSSFDELVQIFKRFDRSSSSNILKDRFKFSKTKQSKDQSIQNYAEQLENMLSKCSYGAAAREMLRDQFVFGLHNVNIQQALLEESSWCFEECVEYALGGDQNKKSVKDLDFDDATSKSKSNKRKQEDQNDISMKKQKIQDSESLIFYHDLAASGNLKNKNKIIRISSRQQWSDYFGFEVKHTYEVCCPWTGQILRS